MTKTLKQLVRVLWEIEKDLHVIASDMKVNNKKPNEEKTYIKLSDGLLRDLKR
ncbi:hypothetical protein ACW9VW_08500 [Lactiplantibacillus plantarum]